MTIKISCTLLCDSINARKSWAVSDIYSLP